jgi:adenylate cyclase class 2
MAHNGRETEIKLAMDDVRSARRLLAAAGFRVSKRRVFEVNVLYDTPDGRLRSNSSLLRIREAGKARILTYKGRPETGRHKSREELEIPIPGAASMGLILERLGFHPAMRYEKYRTEFRQGSGKGGPGIATVDEVPIGVYVELEGTPEWIDCTAQSLGFAETDYITGSYGRLYREWCERQGIQPSNMVFRG